MEWHGYEKPSLIQYFTTFFFFSISSILIRHNGGVLKLAAIKGKVKIVGGASVQQDNVFYFNFGLGAGKPYYFFQYLSVNIFKTTLKPRKQFIV